MYIRKTNNGKYQAIAQYRDNDGKRHQKSAGIFKTKKEAKEKASKLENEFASLNMSLNDISLYDYYIRWYKIYKVATVGEVAQRHYIRLSKFIRQYFNDTKLVNIRRSDYQQFINWYGSNHARESVAKLNRAVRACVAAAIADDVIAKDFTFNVQIAYNKDKRRKVEYLNHDEIDQLIKAVKTKLVRYNTSRYMIYTAILTGMRKAEIQALTWHDIDFLHGTITVNKSWDERKKCFKETKTQASNRVIKVNQELLATIKELRANNSNMVFTNVFNTIPTSNALNKCLREIMTDAGIVKSNFVFHSLRHVHVAYLLSQGVPIEAISKRLGHSNISITLNYYTYLIDEYKNKNDDEIVAKLSQIV